MIQKIKVSLLLLFSSLMLTFSVASPVALASCANPASTQEAIQCGANSAAGESNNDPKSLDTLITRIVNVLSLVVGIAAVIMVIVAGFKYITSAGSTEKVASAKHTLLYAVIGLIIVALAQVIVKFVLKVTTTHT